ncbi:MAG: hypothetical protein ACOCUT_04410, partial [bacterium]
KPDYEVGKEFSEKKSKELKKNIFHDENESLIDALEESVNFNKNALYLTEKRIYQIGKLLQTKNKGKPIYYYGEKIVYLQNIISTNLYSKNPIGLYVWTVIAGIMSLVSLTAAFDDNIKNELEDGLFIVSGIFFIACMIMLINYFRKKGKWIIIEYSSGTIGLNCKYYSKKSVRRFFKNISLVKDSTIMNTNKHTH